MRIRTVLAEVDLQQSLPPAAISLTRAGVTRSAKAIRIGHGDGERLFQAEIQCFADLNPRQKGVHMSRFEEGINEAIDEAVLGEALQIEELAEHIARRVVAAQGALRSEVTVRASYPVVRTTPVSEVDSQEMYELIGVAAATPAGARRALGVSAQGMNACPCAQGLIRAQAEAALAEDGFSSEDIDRIVSLVPIATHNQRARGTLYVGTADGTAVPADELIAIVEDGMSSEIYELMKRSDEQYVVDRAHRRPRFVEDSVREMIRGVVERFPDLGDDTFVWAHQANFETIHTHDVEAERSGLIGEIRGELAGEGQSVHHASLREWLGGA
ncbi:MAG TPA: GTP cyclohydrolase MptA [Miltoncostaeaceae bacterium]|nr:GTP cyclohydrolase MptA [Miltoncostaeaceae bacterium]